ncbi:TetR/AcrR family transcriptional regulator [Undibacterium sp.]|uniref:TetR/AcrR family transcriptional regulator n=1 Tax=Undibacterium sp. TaxID=1914977 RepID=UPI00375162A1
MINYPAAQGAKAPNPNQVDASPDRRQRKANQTLLHVSQTAWAMFELEGFHSVTMEAISSRADIAKATLYKYFPSKEAILEHHFKNEMLQRRDEISIELFKLQGVRSRLDYLFKIEADYLRDKHSYLAPLMKHRMQSTDFAQSQSSTSGMLSVLILVLRAAQESGEIPKKHRPETLANYLNALRSMDLFYWQAHPETSLFERHQQMLNLFSLGVMGDQQDAPLGAEVSA